MRHFEQDRGRRLRTPLHVALIVLAFAAGLWGVFLTASVATTESGVVLGWASVATIVPLAYWPLYAATLDNWMPAAFFYGGWSAAMFLCALHETTYCISSVERPWRPKPR